MDLRIKIASPDKRHKIPCDTFYKVGYSKPCISAWGVGSGSELVIVLDRGGETGEAKKHVY